jgi:hypothetical protein
MDDLLALLATQFPMPEDPLVLKALKRLGHPVQARIDVYKPPHPSDVNAMAYRPGDKYLFDKPPTDTNLIRVNARSPYYKDRNLNRLAALLAHEERHLGGGAESEAYGVQLKTLRRLGEKDSALITELLKRASSR